MAPLKVVVADISADSLSGLPDIVPLRQIGLVVLEGAKPPLDHDVVHPAALTIYALPDVIVCKEPLVFATCELAALITVQDGGLCNLEGIPAGPDAGSGIQCIIQLPSDDTSAVPVDDSSQIQESRRIGMYVISIDHA